MAKRAKTSKKTTKSTPEPLPAKKKQRTSRYQLEDENETRADAPSPVHDIFASDVQGLEGIFMNVEEILRTPPVQNHHHINKHLLSQQLMKF